MEWKHIKETPRLRRSSIGVYLHSLHLPYSNQQFSFAFTPPWWLYWGIHIAVPMTSVATTCVIYLDSLGYTVPLRRYSSTRDQL